jgi:putative acyl-CoA dehydrogenase
MARSPESVELFFDEVGTSAGADPALDAFVLDLRRRLADLEGIESRARLLVERMAIAFQASLLVRHAPKAVADAFVASRVAGERGAAFGTLPAGTDFGAILDRATPQVA